VPVVPFEPISRVARQQGGLRLVAAVYFGEIDPPAWAPTNQQIGNSLQEVADEVNKSRATVPP
jgi:hypothetical protein